jgi:hypothetical protein
LLNSRDDFNHVSLGDLVDTPAGPGLSNLAAKKPGDLCNGAVFGQALGNEGLQQINDTICHDSLLGVPLLGCRIAPFELK